MIQTYGEESDQFQFLPEIEDENPIENSSKSLKYAVRKSLSTTQLNTEHVVSRAWSADERKTVHSEKITENRSRLAFSSSMIFYDRLLAGTHIAGN